MKRVGQWGLVLVLLAALCPISQNIFFRCTLTFLFKSIHLSKKMPRYCSSEKLDLAEQSCSKHLRFLPAPNLHQVALEYARGYLSCAWAKNDAWAVG